MRRPWYRINFDTGAVEETFRSFGMVGEYATHEEAKSGALRYYDQKIKLLEREIEVMKERRQNAEESYDAKTS